MMSFHLENDDQFLTAFILSSMMHREQCWVKAWRIRSVAAVFA
jgi:hypothetical protein